MSIQFLMLTASYVSANADVLLHRNNNASPSVARTGAAVTSMDRDTAEKNQEKGRPLLTKAIYQPLFYADTAVLPCRLIKATTIKDTTGQVLDPVSVYAKKQVDLDIAQQKIERNKTALIQVISRKSIELSSDLTVADMLARITSVSTQNNHTGMAALPIIRGLSPKYSYTTVNGIHIPSPDPSQRFLSLDLFPSAIANQLSVYKSRTPDMMGDAIGGVLDIQTTTAKPKGEFSLQVSSGYHDLFLQRKFTGFSYHAIHRESPYELFGPAYYASGKDFTVENLIFRSKRPVPDFHGSVNWSKRFFDNKLGAAVMVGYENVYSGSDGFLILQNSEPQVYNKAALTDYILRRYDNQSTRKHAYIALDYTINGNNHLSLYGLFLDKKDIETRSQTDTSLSEGRSGPGTGRINITQRSRLHDQELKHFNLEGAHQLAPSLMLQWNGVYSIATGTYPDWAELGINTGRILGADGVIQQTPELLAPLNRLWLRNTEKEKDFKYSLGYAPGTLDHLFSMKVGGLLQYRNRDNFYNNYTFMPALIGNQPQVFDGIENAKWLNNNGPQNPLGTVNTAGTYKADENINGYFVTLEIHRTDFEVVVGTRAEYTDQNIISAVTSNSPYGKKVIIHYNDLLPSLHLKLNLGKEQDLRLSYYKAVGRPSLYDLTFFNMEYEDYNIAGNPFLKRSTADDLDLSYALYASKLVDYFQATAFYKSIQDPYEPTLLNAGDTLYPISQNGLSYIPASALTRQLRNYGPADNYGIELSVGKQLGNFKFTADYTLSYSRIHQLKKYKTRIDPEDLTSDIETITKYQARPLEGQSRHLGGLQLRYELPKNRLNFQIIASYVGKRIHEISGWYGLDEWQKATTMIDLSMEKYIRNRWRLFAKVSNLLDAGRQIYINEPGPERTLDTDPEPSTEILLGKDNYKRQFLLGLSFGL